MLDMVYEYDNVYRPKTYTIHKKRRIPIGWIIGFIVLILLIFFLVQSRSSDTNSPTTQASNVSPTPQSKQVAKNEEELINNLKTVFEGTVGTYSIYVYDLKTNKGYGIHENTVLTAASVAKIPILAGLYKLADNEVIDLDDTITLQEKDIQDFGTGTLRYAKPGTTYSIKTLARLMMEKSDNTAAYIIGRTIVGFPRLQKMVDEWGMGQTNMENNKTSAEDMAILMTKMYRGEIANQTLTKEMLGFMTKTDFEDRIPALLPKDITVYHKTGDEVENMHDVGIVELPNHPYYVGIFALDILKSDEQTKKVIAESSKYIFDYQRKLP